MQGPTCKQPTSSLCIPSRTAGWCHRATTFYIFQFQGLSLSRPYTTFYSTSPVSGNFFCEQVSGVYNQSYLASPQHDVLAGRWWGCLVSWELLCVTHHRDRSHVGASSFCAINPWIVAHNNNTNPLYFERWEIVIDKRRQISHPHNVLTHSLIEGGRELRICIHWIWCTAEQRKGVIAL